MTTTVLLGYTVPGGEPFHIPIAHTVFTGITQQGKSTAQEAIFSRLSVFTKDIPPGQAWKILVFLTKRGEKTFQNVKHFTKPFYRERFDWEYVRGLLEAAWKEKMKFETPWIIRICKGATSLKDVRGRLARALTDEHLREWDKNIYTTLAAYMDKVLPVLEESRDQFADSLQLDPGLNVMDLTRWYVHEEMQMLIIRSCMEEILRAQNDVIVGLPEGWKMLPQDRNTPVKLYFEKFTREGATNNNYLYVDTQDLGGMDKTALRQVSVWIMGKMLEANEVGRLLKQTLGVKVEPREIQTLPLGHFLVAAGDKVTKVYVCPSGVPEAMAKAVAKGTMNAEEVQTWMKQNLKVTKFAEPWKPLENIEDPGAPPVSEEVFQYAVREQLQDFGRRIDALSRRCDGIDDLKKRLDGLEIEPGWGPIQERQGTLQQTNFNVTVKEAAVEFTLTTTKVGGKIMWLAKESFFKDWRSSAEIEQALTERGWGEARITVYKALEKLVEQGFIGTRKGERVEYKLAPFVTFKEE